MLPGTVKNHMWKLIIKHTETKWNALDIVSNGDIVQIKLTNPCSLQINVLENIYNCFHIQLESRIKPSVWIKLDQTEASLNHKINHYYKNKECP
jgi:hypothetical protein